MNYHIYHYIYINNYNKQKHRQQNNKNNHLNKPQEQYKKTILTQNKPSGYPYQQANTDRLQKKRKQKKRMALTSTVQYLSLQNLLENAHKGYAYQLLALQIQIESSTLPKSQSSSPSTQPSSSSSIIESLSKLIQLYMLAVQILESNWDPRYRYFNTKIQSLMKKKHIIEQLHHASTGSHCTPKQALIQSQKQLRENRKNQHEIAIFVNQQQCNIKKVKEILEKQERKFEGISGKIKGIVGEQDKKLMERVRMRKIRSECGSDAGWERARKVQQWEQERGDGNQVENNGVKAKGKNGNMQSKRETDNQDIFGRGNWRNGIIGRDKEERTNSGEKKHKKSIQQI